MTCHEAREAFSDLHDDVLPQPARDAVRGHLQVCPACQAEWSAFQQTIQALSTLGSAEPSPGFAARIRQQLDAPRWWERAARWLFLPVRVKMPVHAAALLVLGLAGLLLYERSPDLHKSTQPLTTRPPAAARGALRAPAPAEAPELSRVPEAVKAKEGGAPPPAAESRTGDTPAQVPGPSAPAQPVAPADVTQAPPRDEQARDAQAVQDKLREAEQAAPTADALQKTEAAPEARLGQADSALSARRPEESPPREVESGPAASRAQQLAQVPAAAPPASSAPSREVSRKTLAARTPDALYSAALTELAGKRYEQAIGRFRAFIAQYPQDPKVPYARLALGDAQAAQGRQPEAIQEYDTLIQQFPQNPLVPTALYRQAQARLALSDPSGCLQLRDLADRFPRAPEAGQARDALAKRCP
jgi:TolA-binding protein